MPSHETNVIGHILCSRHLGGTGDKVNIRCDDLDRIDKSALSLMLARRVNAT